MNVQIIQEPLLLDIYGFSGVAQHKDYAGTAFRIMDTMWKVVKQNNLPNKGQNIWVYEQGHKVFAGVELIGTSPEGTGLEHKHIQLNKYAYYKHTGPYNLIGQAGQQMTDIIKSKGLQTILPYIEMYGHWTKDESKLETELLMYLA